MSTISRDRVWNVIFQLAVVAFAGVIAGCGGGGGAEPATPATVTWEPTSLTVTLLPGTSQTLGAALTAHVVVGP